MMADPRSRDTQDENLDWENLSGPVPMDLIDPEFPVHPPEVAGAASEILSRAESEALAAEAGVPENEVPEAPPPGATLFGGTAALQDEFARIRAEMEAEAEAEKRKKHEAEKEEAAQRIRLEQWMANARARLLKADADLTGPAGRVRIRKEASPSLHSLAQMQKTMHMDADADATRPDGTRMVPAAEAAPDPMATISVPTEEFLTLDKPAQPTLREQAVLRAQDLARQAEQQAARAREESAEPPAPSPRNIDVTALPIAGPSASPAASVLSSNAGDLTAFRPMTREEALTRKVAKLRKVAEAGDNTLALAPAPEGEADERTALHYAIAGVVLIAILVLGLGLFAATQAGLFDGLENRVPFLKPKVDLPAQAKPRPAAAPPAAPSTTAPAAPAPAPAVVAPASVPQAASASAPAKAAGAKPAPAPVALPPGNQPAPRNPAVTGRAAKGKPARPRAAAVAPRARKPAPAADPDPLPPPPAAAASAPADADEIPAYARPRNKAANLGEIILRNSVQAAANIDKDNLSELYNRYALGFPGLSGEVVIGLTVDPGGRILEGSIVSTTTGVDAFDQELLRRVLDWRLRAFPETRPKFISVPFLFPQQGAH